MPKLASNSLRLVCISQTINCTKFNWLHRLISSTTFPSSNHIRDKDNNYKEAQGHTHCNRNKKVEVRVRRTFFSCQKRTESKKQKLVRNAIKQKQANKKHFESVCRLVFQSITPILYFLYIHPKISKHLIPLYLSSVHLRSHQMSQYTKEKLRKEGGKVQNTELCFPNMGRLDV